MLERAARGERALLVQPVLREARHTESEDIAEFRELAASAGAKVADVVRAPVRRADAATLLGSGKLDEVRMAVQVADANLVLVNHALSAGQERNIERALGVRVVDRIGLILDIFALRASTAEGKLQVELAQLRHLSSRLVRGWTHLERQKGGIGLRGPGESQLETDRRLLGERIRVIRERLERVQTHRELGRRARDKANTPLVSLVGYTNAGKSTLFNALTGATVHAADQLFATLDPTVRRVELPGPVPVVIADTVGFIRDLPHELVAAFRATLEETRRAQLLLHVIDATDPNIDAKRAQVAEVLREVGAADVPQIEVLNKIDALESPLPAGAVPRATVGLESSAQVRVSALSGEGLDALRSTVADHFGGALTSLELDLPHRCARLRAQLFDLHAVDAERAGEAGWRLAVRLRPGTYARLCRDEDLEHYVVAPLPVHDYDGESPAVSAIESGDNHTATTCAANTCGARGRAPEVA